ncbi:MAG: glycosyltransferase, partial [Candidatus Moranbacteria bacterium]|nr:glycosyltransferase [Candidatus Moranbacteria bacterium]
QASTDSTPQILEHFKNSRIRIVHNKINMGPGQSRDKAIAIAQGKWLAFTDADDQWKPQRLKTLLQQTNGSEDLMIFDDLLECHDTPYGIVPWRLIHGKKAFGCDGVSTVDVPIEDYVVSKRLVMQPMLPLDLVKKKKINHSYRRFGEDTEFVLKILSFGIKLHYIPKAMYYYRITPGSATSMKKRSTMMREILEQAIIDFNHAPSVQEALKKKIAKVIRDEKFMPFVESIKQKKYFDALKTTANNPTFIIFELFKRLGPSIHYNTHRMIHGGRTRGIK